MSKLLKLGKFGGFSKFGEFDYSPKCSFWEIGWTRYICRHSPTCFGPTRYIRWHSPTYFARTRYIRWHSPTYFARTRLIHPHSPKGFFEKNETRLDTFARVIRHSGKFGASGHCLVKMQLSTQRNKGEERFHNITRPG